MLLSLIMPFHAFLSVWLGTIFGHQAIIQSWKELVILIMFIASLPKILSNINQLQIYLKSKWLISGLLFGLAGIIISIPRHIPIKTLAYGMKTDLFFILLAIILAVAEIKYLAPKIANIIILTGALIGLFGVLQIWFLPVDFLSHFGYSAATIVPYLRINQASPLIRIISTLGGPNQLGSFLILPICLSLTMMVKFRRYYLGLPLIAEFLSIWHSYSRSALAGLVIALLVLGGLLVKRAYLLSISIIMAICVVALAGFVYYKLHTSSTWRYYIYRNQSNQISNIKSSDGLRLAANKEGIREFMAHPFGLGLGTAGPASLYTAKPLITENYYLQIAVETGIIGLVLFILWLAFGLQYLLLFRSQPVAIALISSFFGLSVVNLFLHGWADSSTSLVYFGLMGSFLGSQQLFNKPGKQS